MTAKELREKYLKFFEEKGHKIIPGASLIPEHDPTVLFTTAGMHPLVPFLLGEKHPAGKRLANVQKCIRTGDIDKVGDRWHLTFFEMLGNWSLGNYWKKEAIEWSFEFLFDKKWLGIPKEKLSITVFEGDKDAPKDEETAQIWKDLGIPKERIYYLGKDENWWGPAGEIGPCGPCTEMFYDTGKDKCSSDCRPGCDCGKYSEIWNDVFMEYNRKIKNKKSKIKNTNKNSKTAKPKNYDNEIEYEYASLVQKNVDTGMGVERTVAVLNGQDNVYETELFEPIVKEIKSLAKITEPANSFEKLYNPGQAIEKEMAGLKDKAERGRAIRIIADHIKAGCFILAENIEPSNIEQGYVLRRLIRRAIRYGKQIGIEDVFLYKIAETVIDIYQDIYSELKKNKDFIFEQLIREEQKFKKTLINGLRELEKLVNKKYEKAKEISAEDAFYIYETYGFPLEMIEEELKNYGLTVNRQDFQKAFKKHQELSRAGSKQKFRGGLADHSEQVMKYHTATHLLLAALRLVLGNNVQQRGSNLTAERIRFDFSHPAKLTPEEIKKVEELINESIKQDLKIKCEEMSLGEAKKQGATGVFEKKYGDKVKVYTIFNPKTEEVFSKEICGGPHVERTGILGKFKIIKEQASSAGVRRIKAVLE